MAVKMYQYAILGICLMIDVVWLKDCVKRPVNIVIDSTNLTTRADFEVFIDIVQNVTSRLQGAYKNNVSINVYPYNNNAPCRKLMKSCVRRSINDSIPSEIVEGYANLSSIRYRKHKSQPFCLPCAEFLLKEHFMKRSEENAFGLILTVFPSLKNYINSILHPKYKSNTSYILALVYNSLNTSANIVKLQPHTFARMVTRSSELEEIILTFICPEKFDYRKSILQKRKKSFASNNTRSTSTYPSTSPSTSTYINVNVVSSTSRLKEQGEKSLILKGGDELTSTPGMPGISFMTTVQVGKGNPIVQTTQIGNIPVQSSISVIKSNSVQPSTYLNVGEMNSKNASTHEKLNVNSSLMVQTKHVNTSESVDEKFLLPKNSSSVVLTPVPFTINITKANKKVQIPNSSKIFVNNISTSVGPITDVNIDLFWNSSNVKTSLSTKMVNKRISNYHVTPKESTIKVKQSNMTQFLKTSLNRSSTSSSVYVKGETSINNSTNILVVKPSKSTSVLSKYLSTVLFKEEKEYKVNITNTSLLIKHASNFSNVSKTETSPQYNFTNVLVVQPSVSIMLKDYSLGINDTTEYIMNVTNVLVEEPSTSTRKSLNYSYAVKDISVNSMRNSTKFLSASSSSSIMLENVTKYFRNATEIAKSSVTLEKCDNCSSMSATVASGRPIYKGNSTKVLIIKPTRSAAMHLSTSSNISIAIGNTSRTSSNISITIVNTSRMFASSSTSSLIIPIKSLNFSIAIPRLNTTCVVNCTNVTLEKPQTKFQIDSSMLAIPVLTTTRLKNFTDAGSVPKPTKFVNRSSTSSVLLELRTDVTNSTLSTPKVTKVHLQFSSLKPVVASLSYEPTPILPSSSLTASFQSKLILFTQRIIPSHVLPSLSYLITSETYSSNIYNIPPFLSATVQTSFDEVTQLVFFSSSQNPVSSDYPSSSSVLHVVTFHKVLDEITSFMQQNITKLHIKQESWVKDFIMNTSTLLNDIEENEDSLIHEKTLNFLSFVENTTLKIGTELPVGKNVSLQTEELKLEITAVDPVTFTGYVFSPEPTAEVEENVQLPSNLFENTSLIQKKVSITTMFMKTIPAMRKTEGSFHDIGKLFTISLDVDIDGSMEDIVTYTFNVPENNYSNYKCVFWNSTDWDTKGCIVANVSGSSVVCQCNHMTSFSLLMQVSDYDIEEIHAYVLSMISYIGCSISIVGCVLLLLTYVMFGRLLKVSRNVIHMNLALAITISNALFISADAVHMYKSLCLTVSIAMLYSYLASFFWMLVEGIHVYLLIVKVFKSPNMMKVYCIIGWIVPAVIVAIAGLKFHVNFTRDDFCWISTEGNVIWVFVGPVLFIVVTNGIILITALSTSYKMAVAETDFLRLQQIARLTMLLMPIFGLTWVFGLLAINKQLIIFQYIFTIINSLQGVYIFICYCLLNNEVKQEFERIRRKYQYDSGHTTSSDSHFSVYDQLFHRRLKSVVSIDSSTMVKLTKYDSKLNRYDSVKTESTRASSTYSDTLAKRLNKDYSIELINLNDGNNMSCVNNDTNSMSSSVCPEEHDYGIKLHFEEVPLTNGHYSCGDFVNDNCTYDTFKAKK